jgi:serine/threonine protein kinase
LASSELDGFILGNYNLIEVLGMGAMGFVYRARQLNLERDVAIKILSPNLAHHSDYMALFIREARTAASLEHPHIVPVFDYGIQDEMSYVVMRLLSGGSLGDRISYRLEHDLPMPSLPEISHILNQAASALDYAHEHGVIHRDIKPNNIMFDQHGVAYLVDFGIAKLVGTTSSIKGSTFLGTPSFMAPEQWEGQPPTPAVDQYALAAVIYMMITGRAPFEADFALALMKKHLSETPLDVQHYRSDAPEEINSVLQRAMAKQPGERFPNNRAFAEAFTSVIREAAGEPVSEFTSFVLPPASFSLPIPTGGKVIPTALDEGTAPSQLPNRQSRSASGRARNLIIWIQSGLLMLAIVLIAILLVRDMNNGSTPTQVVVASVTDTLASTATLTSSELATDSALVAVSLSTLEPSSTTSPSDTATPVLTETQAPTATPSPTPTNTAIFTVTAPQPSLTSTASRTSSPVPTDTASFTATIVQSLMAATATLTDTPSATRTATETPTATATPTISAPRPTVNWQAGTQLKINNPNGVWLRSRPSSRASQVATLANNNGVTATGDRHYDGRQWWWEVTAAWGAVGWVEQYALVQA